jgi:very-short-patch-repair endonuclease/rubrerythrin
MFFESDIEEIYSEINKYKNKKRIYYNKFSDKLKQYLEYKFPGLDIEEQFYLVANNYNKIPKCKLEGCNKKAVFLKKKKKYSDACSPAHAMKVKMKEKYGETNPSKIDEFIEKRNKTLIEKYGGIGNASNVIKEKYQMKMKEKYGETNPSKIDEFIEKRNKTLIEKYGGIGNASNIIKEKSTKTILKKFNVDNVFKSDEIKRKIKETNIEKYGYEHPNKNEKIKYKIKNKFKKRIFNRIKDKLCDIVEPLFDVEQYEGVDYKIKYQWKCKKCGNVFEDDLYSGNIPRCPICYPIIKPFSDLENDLFNSIKFENKIKNDRTILDGKEVDILIPDKKIAIEFNGLFWHSELNGKDRNYHLNRTKLAESKGYQLIHIFEDEWINKRDIVLSIIHSKLGIFERKIYARKCEVKEISNELKSDFLFKNHIQGDDNSSIKLGLFYNGEMVSIMTFGKSRFDKKIEYEMFRYCSLLNTQVIGGASKLLNYFVKNYFPKSIVTFADRRYSNGKLYFNLGFEFVGYTEPNFYVLKDYKIRENRIKYQKHKLNKLDRFDESLSAWENLQMNGYDRIWDCGNMKFIKFFE